MPISSQEITSIAKSIDKITAGTAVILMAGFLLWHFISEAPTKAELASLSLKIDDTRASLDMHSQDSIRLYNILRQICVNTAPDPTSRNECLR